MQNMAATYANYPSLPRPWLAMSLQLPAWVELLAVLLGVAAPVAMGLFTVWLVRPHDRWADLSAGLTTALAATLSSFAAGLGWPILLALVVVPSINDLTVVCNTVRTPTLGETGETAHPSQALVERYPDLERVSTDERGPMFMPKIVSDQIVGSIYGIWLGILLALLSCGGLALAGTLAAGYLLRRGDRPRAALLPYLELTLSGTGAVVMLASALLAPVGSTFLDGAPWSTVFLLLLVTGFVTLGVMQRWPWLLRLALAFVWVLLFAQAGGRLPWRLAGPIYVFTAFLLACHAARRWRRPIVEAT
jgi:hypothetical protein